MDSVLIARLRAHVSDPTHDLTDLGLDPEELRTAVLAFASFEPPERTARIVDLLESTSPDAALVQGWGSVAQHDDAPLLPGSLQPETLDHLALAGALEPDPIDADIAFASGADDDPFALLGLDTVPEPAMSPTSSAAEVPNDEGPEPVEDDHADLLARFDDLDTDEFDDDENPDDDFDL